MRIKVYSTNYCPYCTTLKEFLKEKGIGFEDVNVQENEEEMQKMIDKSGQMGVPVVDIDGQIVVGFDRERIIQILGISG
ncbi:MAG: thioredoxin family protein [Patescibacteria group bacterium]|nr:thioredoxin family protein [Patescibacteria group bacterium]